MSDNSSRSFLKNLPSSWQLIPIREFPHLFALKDQSGEVIATVHSDRAQEFQALPELLAASQELQSAAQELFERLRGQHSQWGPESTLGRFEKALALFRPAKGTS